MSARLAFAFALALLAPTYASACSCRPFPETVEEHIERNDVVFLGNALGGHSIPVWEDGWIEIYTSTKFLVISSVKGVARREGSDTKSYVYVRHKENEGHGANCGVTFVKGEGYRVFANSYNQKNYTSYCYLTRKETDPANVPWIEYERATAALKK